MVLVWMWLALVVLPVPILAGIRSVAGTATPFVIDYSPTYTNRLGPQTGSVRGNLSSLEVSPCIATPDDTSVYTGRILLLSNYGGPCFPDQVFIRLAEWGVAAVITPDRNGPPSGPSGTWIYLRYGSENDEPIVSSKMPFLILCLDDFTILQRQYDQSPQINVVVSPDYSKWHAVFDSIWYTITFQVVIGGSYLLIALIAILFFIGHLNLLVEKFHIANPVLINATDLKMRIAKHCLQQFGIKEVALIIEMCTGLFLGLFFTLNGYCSVGRFNNALNQFGSTGLAGWGFLCDALAALFWKRNINISMLVKEEGLLTRFRRSAPLLFKIVAILFITLPTIFDTTLCLAFAYPKFQYWLSTYKIKMAIAFPVCLIFGQLYVGPMCIIMVTRYNRFVRGRGKEVTTQLDSFIRHQSRWTFMLGVSMVSYSLILPLLALKLLFTHIGWPLIMIPMFFSKISCAICRIMILRPAKRAWGDLPTFITRFHDCMRSRRTVHPSAEGDVHHLVVSADHEHGTQLTGGSVVGTKLPI